MLGSRWEWEWKNDGVLVGMEVPPVLVRQAGGLDSQRRLRGRGTITCWILKDEGRAQLCKAAPDDGRQEVPRWGRMGLVASSALRRGGHRQRRIDGASAVGCWIRRVIIKRLGFL